MSTAGPTLTLDVGARSAHDARAWVTQALADIGREDLVETARLAVSELVTNAVLHGDQPISVGLGGTRLRPRVEVRDGSPVPPVLTWDGGPRSRDDAAGVADGPDGPHDVGDDDLALEGFDGLDGLDGLDAVLATFGRGLHIVARCSQAWGADIDDDGKVVWSVPATTISEEPGPDGLLTGLVPRAPADALAAGEVVVISDVPVTDALDFVQHVRELHREAKLVSLGDGAPPVALALTALLDSPHVQLQVADLTRRVGEAVASGRATFDSVVPVRTSGPTLDEALTMLRAADAFAAERRLLSLVRTQRQLAFQQWYLAQVRAAQRGEASLPWTPAPAPRRPASA